MKIQLISLVLNNVKKFKDYKHNLIDNGDIVEPNGYGKTTILDSICHMLTGGYDLQNKVFDPTTIGNEPDIYPKVIKLVMANETVDDHELFKLEYIKVAAEKPAEWYINDELYSKKDYIAKVNSLIDLRILFNPNYLLDLLSTEETRLAVTSLFKRLPLSSFIELLKEKNFNYDFDLSVHYDANWTNEFKKQILDTKKEIKRLSEKLEKVKYHDVDLNAQKEFTTLSEQKTNYTIQFNLDTSLNTSQRQGLIAAEAKVVELNNKLSTLSITSSVKCEGCGRFYESENVAEFEKQRSSLLTNINTLNEKISDLKNDILASDNDIRRTIGCLEVVNSKLASLGQLSEIIISNQEITKDKLNLENLRMTLTDITVTEAIVNTCLEHEMQYYKNLFKDLLGNDYDLEVIKTFKNGNTKNIFSLNYKNINYSQLNKGHKYISALKLIAVIQKHIDIYIPVLIDNAEVLSNIPDILDSYISAEVKKVSLDKTIEMLYDNDTFRAKI